MTTRHSGVRHGCAAMAVALFSTAFVVRAQAGGDEVLCAGDGRPCIDVADYDGSRIYIHWHDSQHWDTFNVRWSRPGRDETQLEDGAEAFTLNNAHPNTLYTFKVQACVTGIFGSNCTAWEFQTVQT